MANDSNRPDVAVFIDFENVYVSVRDKLDANPNFESIMDRCEDLGRVVIARAYADWYRYPRVTSALYANGIEPMYVPTYYYDRDMGRTGRPIKNSVDMNLCVDAMKTLFTNPNIAKFVLATGDRDFIPLVNTIRQQGKEVIVIGIGGAASAHLAQSADEFIFYEQLLGKPPASLNQDQPRAKMPEKGREQEPDEAPRQRDREAARPEPTPPSVPEAPPTPDVFDTLVKAINLARERGYVCSFGSLKLLMKELMGGDFKESRYKDAAGRPFAKFKDFVMEAERRGKVQVFTNGTVNEVFLPGEDPYKLSQFAQDLKEEPPAAAIAPFSESRPEGRVGSSNGRRRRRRPRGGRQNGQQPVDEAQLDEQAAEELETDAAEENAAPELIDEHEAEEVFEDLLDRIEQEDAETAALTDRDPMTILDPPTAAADQAPADEQAAEPAPGAPAPETRPFVEQEWAMLRDAVGRFDRPVSFVQIHDALRDARNQASLDRTNEELRTLIKQAINNGMLERLGKGSRISYRLAALPAEESAATDRPSDEEAPDQMALIEQAQTGQAQPDEQETPAEPTQPEEQAPDQMSLLEQAQANAPEDTASEQERFSRELAEIDQQLIAEQLEPESVLSGVTAPEPVAPAANEPEAPEQTPARSRRRRKAAPAAEAPEAQEAPAAEAAPRTRRRRKAQAADQPAAEAPAEEPAPKSRRGGRRKKNTETPDA